MISQLDICKKLLPVINQSPVYEKSGTYKFRIPEDGERLETIVNGKLETVNTAKDSVAITGPLGEEYFIPKLDFDKKYEIIDQTTAKAKGKIKAVKVTINNFVPAFVARWGEEMRVTIGGWYACPVDGDEIYFIDQHVFDQTYKMVG